MTKGTINQCDLNKKAEKLNVKETKTIKTLPLQIYRGYEPCGSVNPKHRKQGKPRIYLRYTCNCSVLFATLASYCYLGLEMK